MEDPETEHYRAAVQLIAHSETTTWHRMNSFLALCALLGAGWHYADAVWAKVSLAAFGVILSGVFCGVAVRSRAYVLGYVDHAKGLENERGGPVNKVAPKKGFGAYGVALVVPGVCAAAFIVLGVVALAKR